jgi:hypothetical protein
MDWRLIHDDDGNPKIQVRYDESPGWQYQVLQRLTDGHEPPVSVLHELALDPASGLIQIDPGHFYVGKLDEPDGYPGH